MCQRNNNLIEEQKTVDKPVCFDGYISLYNVYLETYITALMFPSVLSLGG